MNDPEAIDFLETLVRTRSVSGHESAAVRTFVDTATRLGCEAHMDEVGNAVARVGKVGPRVVLLGHIDTVPGVVEVRREDGRLFGRGSVDAKGPLVTFLAAASRASASGQLNCRVEVVGCVEEEVSSSRGAHYRATQPAPDACIVGEPSGWQGITIGYKGFVRLRLRQRAALGHTAGPKGSLPGEACRTWTQIESQAEQLAQPDAPLFDRVLTHLETMRHTSDDLFESVELDAKLRLPVGLAPQQAVAWVREVAPSWEVDSEGGVPAWSGSRTTPLARALARSIRENQGRVRFVRKTGTADSNVVSPAWGCPIVAYGPGDSTLDHTPHEHIELAEFSRSVQILTDLLCTWPSDA